MKFNKVISTVLAATMTLGLLVGCGTTKEEVKQEETSKEEVSRETVEREEVRVLIKWAESQISNWTELVEEYNADASNPITISLEFYGSEGYDEKVRAELMGDNPAGVVQLMKTTFNEFAANGQLEEISGFIADQGWPYNKGALAWAGPLTNENGGVYGIPDFANTSCIFYNTALFEELGIEIPSDVDSLKAAAATLNENGYKAIVTGATNWCALDLFANPQAQLVGADFLVDCYNGEAKYNDPKMVEALTIVNDLIEAGVIDETSADYTDDDAIAEFVMGNAGMYTAHTGMTASIDAVKDEDFSYDIVEKMNFVENPKTSVAVTWGSMWCIPANVQNKEAAQEALAFLFGEKVQKNDVEVLGKIVNVEGWNEGLSHPALITASKQLEGAGTSESFYLLDMVSSKVFDNMVKGIQEMIRGNETPQSVLDNAQAVWEEELSQK